MLQKKKKTSKLIADNIEFSFDDSDKEASDKGNSDKENSDKENSDEEHYDEENQIYNFKKIYKEFF